MIEGGFDKMLQPGERVIFEVGGMRIGTLGWAAAGLLGFMAASMAARDYAPSRPLYVLIIAAACALMYSLLFVAIGNAAAVTDRRLLYRRGLSPWRLIETPLSEIAAIDYAIGHVTVHRRGGERFRIRAVTAPLEVALAILRQTDLPAPPSLRAMAPDRASGMAGNNGG